MNYARVQGARRSGAHQASSHVALAANAMPVAVPNFHSHRDWTFDLQIPQGPQLLQTPRQPANNYVRPPDAPRAPAVPQRAARPVGPARYKHQISQELLPHTFNPAGRGQMLVPREQVPKKRVGRPTNESRKQAKQNLSPQPRAGDLWPKFPGAAFGSASSAGCGGSFHPSIPSIPVKSHFGAHSQLLSPPSAAHAPMGGGSSGDLWRKFPGDASVSASSAEGGGSSYPSLPNIPVVSHFGTYSQPPNPRSATPVKSSGSGDAESVATPSTEVSHRSGSRIPISFLIHPTELSTSNSTSISPLVSDTSATEIEKRMEDAATAHSVGGTVPALPSDELKLEVAEALWKLRDSTPERHCPITTGYPVTGVTEKDKKKELEPRTGETQNGNGKGNRKRGRLQEGTTSAGEDAGRSAKRRSSEPTPPLRQSARLKEAAAKAKDIVPK